MWGSYGGGGSCNLSSTVLDIKLLIISDDELYFEAGVTVYVASASLVFDVECSGGGECGR